MTTRIDDPLVFLAQPDSLMVTDTYARENHLGLGAKVPMSTMDGQKLFTIRGIMKSGGLTSAFGGNLAVMDVYAAQKIFGRGRKFDRIDLALKDGANLEQVTAKLESLLGPGFQVQEPSARAQQFDSISRVYTLTANITSVFALFIGMFIIYNTFQIAVTQRRAEIGILRALGATRGQIRTLFLGESVVAGLFGSVLGLLVGDRDRARHDGLHRIAAGRDLRYRAKGRRDLDRSSVDDVRGGVGRDHERGRGGDTGA